MDITVVLNQVLMLFFPLVIGYIVSKLKLLNEHFQKNASSLLFNVTLPCSILVGLQVEFSRDTLIKSGFLILISVVIMIFLWACGVVSSKILKLDKSKKNVFIYALMFSNFSFMGYPVAQAFMGDKGFLYATMFSLPMYALVQSWGVALIDSDGNSKGFKLKYILNAPLVAAVVGFIMFLSGLRFPQAIDGTVKSLGAITTPLAMILAGSVISGEPLKNGFNDWRVYVLSALRLVVLPLVVFWVMKLAMIDIDICRISAIITMMPTAANIVMTSAAFGKDSSYPAKTVLLTTLLSIITIPVIGLLIF